MWIKFWSACLLVTLVNAEYLYDSNPYAHFGGYATSYDNYKPTNYKFEYGVSDPHTGDHKSQWEVKENGVVRGAYSLLEPDGTTRVVEYYADDTGFHADVKKIGTAVHAAPEYGQLHSLSDAHVANSLAYNGYGHGGVTHSYGAPIAAPVKIAAPVAAPLEVHHAPIAQVQHIAPVPQVIAPQIHHLGTPLDYGYGHEIPEIYSAPEAHYHHEKVYAAPAPVLQHPSPFKVHAEPHYAPAPIIKEYAHYQPEPQIVKYAEPQIVKEIVQPIQPQIVKYAEPQIVKEIVQPIQPQILKYAEPQIVKEIVQPIQPQIVKYAEPQIVKEIVQPVVKYAAPAPAPEYYAKYVEPSLVKYAPEPVYTAQEYIPAPAPVPVAKVAVATKVQGVNPFARFFAPLAKYFSAPAPVPVAQKAVVVPTKVVPTPVYAEAPTKYVNYEPYQYKPEVVISSPHNYGPGPHPGYSYSHDY